MNTDRQMGTRITPESDINSQYLEKVAPHLFF